MSGEIRITINGDDAAQFLERLSGLSASINSKVSRSFNQGALKSLSRDVDVAAKNLEQATKGVESLHDTLQDINGLSMGLRSFSDNVGKMAASVKNLTPTLNRAGQVAGDVATDVNKLDALLPKLEEMLKNFSGVVNDGAKMSGSIRHGSSILLNDLVKDFHKLQNTAIQGIVSLGDPSKLARVTETANQVQEVLDAMANLQHKGLDDEERAGFALRLQEEMKTMLEDTKRVLNDEIKKGEDIERLQKILEKGSTHMRDYSDKAAKSIEQGFDQLKNLQLVSLGRSLKELPKSFMEWKKDRQLLKQQAEKGGEEAAAANQAIGRLGTTGGLLMGVLTGIISVLFKIDAENAQLNQGLLKFGALGLGLNKGGNNPFEEWQKKIRKFSGGEGGAEALKLLAAGSGKFFIPNEMVLSAAQSFHTSGVAMQQLEKYGTDFDAVINSAAFLSEETGLDINRVASLESEFMATYRQGLGATKQTIYTIGKQAQTAGVSQEAFLQAVQSTSAQTMLYRNSLLETSTFLTKLAQTARFSGKKGLEVGKRYLDHLTRIGESDDIFKVYALDRGGRMVEAAKATIAELSRKTRTEEEDRRLKQAETFLSAHEKGQGAMQAGNLWRAIDSTSQTWVLMGGLLQDSSLVEKIRSGTAGWQEIQRASPFLATKSQEETRVILEAVSAVIKGKVKSLGDLKTQFGPQLEKITKKTESDSADRFNAQFGQVQKIKQMLHNWLHGNDGITGILGAIKTGITTLVNLLRGKTESGEDTRSKRESAALSGKTTPFQDRDLFHGSGVAREYAQKRRITGGNRGVEHSATESLLTSNQAYFNKLMQNKEYTGAELSKNSKGRVSASAATLIADAARRGTPVNAEMLMEYAMSPSNKLGLPSDPTSARRIKENFVKMVNTASSANVGRFGALDMSKLMKHLMSGKTLPSYMSNLSQQEKRSDVEVRSDVDSNSEAAGATFAGSGIKPPMRVKGSKDKNSPGGRHELAVNVFHKGEKGGQGSSTGAAASSRGKKNINTYGRPGATTSKFKNQM